jgi:hemerythrin-like domain-containing protein
MLNEYGVLLRNHLLKENMRLYIYLQQRVADDEVNTRLVRSFRKEMDGMAKTALNFLEKYKAIEQLPANQQAEFIIELESIGAVVQERMHREENLLYPLYSPSYLP